MKGKEAQGGRVLCTSQASFSGTSLLKHADLADVSGATLRMEEGHSQNTTNNNINHNICSSTTTATTFRPCPALSSPSSPPSLIELPAPLSTATLGSKVLSASLIIGLETAAGRLCLSALRVRWAMAFSSSSTCTGMKQLRGRRGGKQGGRFVRSESAPDPGIELLQLGVLLLLPCLVALDELLVLNVPAQDESGKKRVRGVWWT